MFDHLAASFTVTSLRPSGSTITDSTELAISISLRRLPVRHKGEWW
ncbi:hypothetical protein [Bradyrhizobium sp. S69]|nr:hypothetical protein [Bradyrhizobium sp. S69]